MAPREPRATKAAGSPREEGGPPPEGGGGGGGVTPLMGLPPADDDTHRPQAVRAPIDMENDGIPPASLTAHPHGWQDATRAVVAAWRNMDRWSCEFLLSSLFFFFLPTSVGESSLAACCWVLAAAMDGRSQSTIDDYLPGAQILVLRNSQTEASPHVVRGCGEDDEGGAVGKTTVQAVGVGLCERQLVQKSSESPTVLGPPHPSRPAAPHAYHVVYNPHALVWLPPRAGVARGVGGWDGDCCAWGEVTGGPITRALPLG